EPLAHSLSSRHATCVPVLRAAPLSSLFSNTTAPPAISTLSLHDALPISAAMARRHGFLLFSDECYSEIYTRSAPPGILEAAGSPDRKSTRLNSSHGSISYAVFCLKKKKNKKNIHTNEYCNCDRHNTNEKL